MVTHGTSHLIEQALVGPDGIDEAFVHGSWAARTHGEAGSSAGDVDELIVGQPDPQAVNDSLADPETELGREVNVTYISRERWHSTRTLS